MESARTTLGEAWLDTRLREMRAIRLKRQSYTLTNRAVTQTGTGGCDGPGLNILLRPWVRTYGICRPPTRWQVVDHDWGLTLPWDLVCLSVWARCGRWDGSSKSSRSQGMTLSTKPEVHNIPQRRQTKTEPRPQATLKISVKFCQVIFRLCDRTNKQRQIY